MDSLKQINPSKAVCFTGHRPDRLPGRGEPVAPETVVLINALRKHIENVVNCGKDTFINGLMAGWDILAAEQVVLFKKTFPNIRIVTIAPYSMQFFTREKCWTDVWIRRAKEVYRNSEICVSLSKSYKSGIYYERNRVMVDCSSELICYSDGGSGGTQYTMNYAAKKGRIITNLYHGYNDNRLI